MRGSCLPFVLVAAWLSEPSDSGMPRADEPALTLRIVLNSPTIDFDQSFAVVVKNVTSKPIRIWEPQSRSGYYQLRFDFLNSRTGDQYQVHKREVVDEQYWASLADKDSPEEAAIELEADGERTISVAFSELGWGHQSWTGLPSPNSPDSFAVSARFENARASQSRQPEVWTGIARSAPTMVRFMASRLTTPHDYLRCGFGAAAIEMMRADPGLIALTDDHSWTPLHAAAAYGHADAVQWLLEHAADVDAVTRINGVTPLHLAEELPVISLLLQRNPDLTICSGTHGRTPLQDAAANLIDAETDAEKQKWRTIMRMYLDAGADYDLLTAIYLDDQARVRTILRQHPELADNFQGESPLRTAAALGRVENCRYLIKDHNVDVNDFERGAGYPIIKEALAYPEIVRLLIEHGADLNTRITWQAGRSGIWIVGDDATALHHAAADGVPETITLLLDCDVDLLATARELGDDQGRQTALDVAAFFGKADNATAILDHPQFDAVDREQRQELLNRCLWDGAFPSWLAREADRPKLLEILLDHGADPNTRRHGLTPLAVAAGAIHPDSDEKNRSIRESVAVLRRFGARMDLVSAVSLGDEAEMVRLLKADPQSVNARRHDGYPALHVAVGMDYGKFVGLLLASGADVDIRNQSESTGSQQETPLHCAAFWGRDAIALQLIAAGANVNALNERGRTPLHDAVRLSNVGIIGLLLDNGARTDIRDTDGETPLDQLGDARSSQADEMRRVFREHAARGAK